MPDDVNTIEYDIEIPGENPDNGTQDTVPETIRLVYIGPSLPFEHVRPMQILEGTEQEIRDFMKPVIEKYPEIISLLAPPYKLSVMRHALKRKDSILRKYYQDIQAKSRYPQKG